MEAMEARLPHDKHENAMGLVDSTLAQHSVTHRSLEMTVGFSSLASKVVPASRPFLRRLYNTLTTTSQTHHIGLSSEIKKYLSWCQMCLRESNGIRLLHHPRQIVQLLSDASGQEWIGGYCLRTGETLSSRHIAAQLFSTTGPQRHKAKHINFKEMHAVLHTLHTWTTVRARMPAFGLISIRMVINGIRLQTWMRVILDVDV